MHRAPGSKAICWTLAAALLAPCQLQAASGEWSAPRAIADVALAEGGLLSGQLMNAAGAVQPGAVVVLSQEGRQVAETVTDEQGRFAFQGVRGGVHDVTAAGQTTVCRLWTAGTAPPVARTSLLVVSGPVVIRGAMPDSGTLVGSPWLWAGLIGAAITLPIALSNDDKPKSSN